MLSFFDKYICTENLGHWIFHCRDVDDQTILSSDWMRANFGQKLEGLCNIEGKGTLVSTEFT